MKRCSEVTRICYRWSMLIRSHLRRLFHRKRCQAFHDNGGNDPLRSLINIQHLSSFDKDERNLLFFPLCVPFFFMYKTVVSSIATKLFDPYIDCNSVSRKTIYSSDISNISDNSPPSLFQLTCAVNTITKVTRLAMAFIRSFCIKALCLWVTVSVTGWLTFVDVWCERKTEFAR